MKQPNPEPVNFGDYWDLLGQWAYRVSPRVKLHDKAWPILTGATAPVATARRYSVVQRQIPMSWTHNAYFHGFYLTDLRKKFREDGKQVAQWKCAEDFVGWALGSYASPRVGRASAEGLLPDWVRAQTSPDITKAMALLSEVPIVRRGRVLIPRPSDTAQGAVEVLRGCLGVRIPRSRLWETMATIGAAMPEEG